MDLGGVALAYRRDDGRVELVPPLSLAGKCAVTGAAGAHWAWYC